MLNVNIGVDMGGTNIKIGFVHEDQLLVKTTIPALSNNALSDRLNAVKKHINQLLQDNSCTPKGIGISFPDIVDTEEMKILGNYVKYGRANEFDLKQWALDAWNIPLVLENDARAALIGEWQYGAGKQCKDVVLMTLGTGIGTAAIQNNQILRGKHFLSGILGGHFTINNNGSLCSCGNIGCLETEASSWVLPKKIKDDPDYNKSLLSKEKHLDFEALFKLASSDFLAKKIRNQCISIWAMGLVNLIHAYDPEKIIIGGGVMKSKNIILPILKKHINEHAWIKKDSITILAATDVEYAAIFGMNYLIKQKI
ncbi:ROK family protein [Bacteroidota bacterium]